MKKLFSIILLIFISLNIYSNDLDPKNFPQYILSGKDTIGVAFTVKQAQKIDNDYELMDILKEMKLNCDSLQKYWIKVNNENGDLLALFKIKISEQDSIIFEYKNLVVNLKQQLEDHAFIESALGQQLEIKKEENKNLTKDLRRTKFKSVVGWTGTATGFTTALGILLYFLLHKNK